MEGGGFVSKKKPQILASLAATIGAFGLGTVLGWSSPAFPSLDATRPFDLTDNDKSWIASLALLGAAASTPIAGIFVELLGRKSTILMACIPFCVGWLLMGLTANKLYMCIGRFMTGFCGGALYFVIPIYISEITEGNIGLRLATGVEVAITAGILFAYTIGAYVNWSWLCIYFSLFPLLSFVLLYCMPETPRYLLTKGKLCEASRRLSWLRGAGFSLNVDEELQETKRKIEETKEKGGRCRDFFTLHSIKWLLICLILMILQQGSGIYPILFYAIYIFREADIDMDVNNAAMAFGFAYIFGTVLSASALDNSGRKRLVILSEVAMAAALGLLGGYFYLPEEYADLKSYATLVPVITLMAYISAFAVGMGPVPQIIMREMFPLGTLGFASSIASTVSWGLAFAITYHFDYMKKELGNAWCYWTFAIVCISGAFFTLCIVPETKGKTAEQIQQSGIGKRGAAAGAKIKDSLKLSNIPKPKLPPMPKLPKFPRKSAKNQPSVDPIPEQEETQTV